MWRNSRVLITGGAGLIGSHIADILVREGASEVIILDNFVRGTMDNLVHAQAASSKDRPVTIVRGDIRDIECVDRTMDGVDVLFHQAAIRITQCAEEPRLAMEVMADGTFNVLEAAVKAKVRKVVVASSASVYGLADTFPTREDHHPYNNVTLYGAAKTFKEGLLRSFQEMYGLEYVGLRYFNVYGARMDIYGAYTEVLIRWMDRIADGKSPLIFGDGNQTMDFVYVEDIARANILAAQANTTGVFNIASGVETSLNDLATTLMRVMGSQLEIEYGPERKVNAVPRRLADTRAAQEHLGFKAEIGLEDGLRRLVSWWSEKKARETVNA